MIKTIVKQPGAYLTYMTLGGFMASEEELKAEIEQLRGENQKLKTYLIKTSQMKDK